MAPRKIDQVSSKPNTEKKLRVRVKARRAKAAMGKVKEEQECLRNKQREIVARFDDMARHCDELRQETEMIVKQSAITRAKLLLMFRILKAREIGDLVQAADLTLLLRETIAMEKANSILDEDKDERRSIGHAANHKSAEKTNDGVFQFLTGKIERLGFIE